MAQGDRRKCRCPVGRIQAACPFSYANGWHERRDAMLLQVDPAAVAQHAGSLTPQQESEARARLAEYLLADG